MSAAFSAQIFLPDDDATTALGHRIAPRLRAGDTLLLSGPIGSGKTHLARAIIQTRLGRAEDVPSPTFTLVQSYDADVEIWHADLYRLGDAMELIELGLDDALESAICLIEWPDRFTDWPKGALNIAFSAKADGRALHLTSDADWSHLNV